MWFLIHRVGCKSRRNVNSPQGLDFSKVLNGEITQDSSARVIRDGAIVFNGKIGTIFREKNQTKQVSAGLECGITIKDFTDFKKRDIIEAYNSTITERRI